MYPLKIVGPTALLAIAAGVTVANDSQPLPDKQAPVQQPSIEVVFVLDTTGSMSGLIEGAKQKIWAIANLLASAEPAPEIKMGLVGYRDRGDAYITKRTDLTTDLDQVYADLMSFSAAGGGDGPESVNQALNEAVKLISWSTDSHTYRVIFLVGDFPPHMDYEDDVRYPESCKLAAQAGITINTIQCGTHSPTEPVWRQIASLSEGRYFRVEQSGGAILASTPFDDDLANLARELDETRVYYGDEAVREEARERALTADAIYAGASTEAQAQRAVFNASAGGAKNFLGRNDLVHDVAEGVVELGEIDSEQLPANLQAMTVAERTEFVQEQIRRRTDIQQQIEELSVKRDAVIKEQIEKAGRDGQAGFDQAIFESVHEQASRVGIELTKEESH